MSPIEVLVNVIVVSAFLIIVVSVILDFKRYHKQNLKVISGERSLVETGSMTAFFIVYYMVIKLRLFEVNPGAAARTIMIIVGLTLIIVGVVFNVYGRVMLKSNWANQIKIYEGHRLTTSGPYSIVRHPLYASLIWIFIGGSLTYSNILSLLLTLCIFVPMMWIRAKSEDNLLFENFGSEFTDYRVNTGMFLPKIRRR